MNTLYQGDNLAILRNMPDASVDLICTDPPFNTGKDWGAFSDKWEGGLKGYLKFMEARLIECRRVLKDTGSLYLHCDPTASHYLKVMLDGVFGIKQFRNEIVWKRHNSHSDKLYGNIHDNILYYSFSKKEIPDAVRIPLDENRIKGYSHCDQLGNFESADLTVPRRSKRGRYSVGVLTGFGDRKGESGKAWRGIFPESNRHWSAPRTGKYAEYIEKHFIPNYRNIKSIHERLDMLDNANLIYWTQNGKPRLKRYLAASVGMPPQSIWLDISIAPSKERLGYPTQKPLALYERMIKASSNQGDIVLDPFSGSGTTLDAAHTLGRQWIGIDVGDEAINVIQSRLRDRHGLEYERDYELINC